VPAPAHPAQGATRQVQQLIVTICGLYARGDRPIAVSDLLRLVAEPGVDEGAARSALSRLKKRGVLVSDRTNGSAAYRLDPALEDVFAEGDERIFGHRRAEPGDPWVLAAFSVPESQRHLRHRLRKVLVGRGFGTVGAALWIAPEHVLPHLRHELEREGLTDFVELFRAEPLDADARAKVADWWDLDALAKRYAAFTAQFEPVRRRWAGSADAPDPASDARAFADYVRLLTAWRRLPFLDPGLPTAYLPADWAGTAAEQLFTTLHERLSGPAARHSRAVSGSPLRPGDARAGRRG
jgi:phenylacetic acid degradation operon negative regulatory protein